MIENIKKEQKDIKNKERRHKKEKKIHRNQFDVLYK